MILSKEPLGNLINGYRTALKKFRVTKLFRALVEVGLIVAGSAGTAGAVEPLYYYTGESSAGAASDEEKWQGADGLQVPNLIVKEEGNPNVYRFQSGIYDGSQASQPVWLIGEKNGGVQVVSEGPLTIQKWGTSGIPPNQGVITALDGEIVFGDNVSILDNYSSAATTKGGGALFSNKRIVFGDNAKVIHNMTAPPIGGSYYGGGAIFLNGGTEGEAVFGKSALIEKNEANYGGAIYAIGSVTFGEGAIIRENRAGTQGGALHVEGTLTLNPGSRVESNKVDNESAKTYGGAFFITGTGNISGTTFKNNKAISTSTSSGGAIYIQSGSLNLSDGTVMEDNGALYGGAVFANSTNITINHTSLKNNNATNGGALFVSKSSVKVQDESGGKNLKETVFEGNTAVASGGAIYAQTSSTVSLGYGTQFLGNQAKNGGAAYVSGGSLTTHGGRIGETATGTVFEGNIASSYGGAIYAANTTVTLGSGTLFDGNQAKMGGAITAVNSTLNVTDTLFRNNTSSSAGGAIFLQGGNLTFKVTETSATPAISGNTSASGGFLYLTKSDVTFDIDRDQQLQIGDPLYSGQDVHMDSLGIMASSSMKKTGEGELKVNSSMEELWGTVSVDAGTMSVARHWNIKNTVAVTGGTLDLPSFSFQGEAGKLLIEGGTLMTNTGQIFQTALNREGANREPGGVSSEVSSHMDFSSGLISFNDAKYNLQYAGSAAELLGAAYDGEGQQGNKEIIFTGDLYTAIDPEPPVPEPDPVPGPSDTVSVGELKDNSITNVVLGNVTITTATDTEPEKGKNLIVGSEYVDDPRFSDAEGLPGSIGGRNLHLGTEGSGVAIVGGHYLTLVGGSPDTSLIEAGSDKTAPVDVHVGGMVNGKMSSGTFNLGTTAMASGGVLRGNVQMGEASVLNVRAGEHSITGESGNTGGQAVSGVTNDGGALNIAAPATLRATLKQTAGETSVAGTLASSSVEIEGGLFNVSGTARIGQLTQRDGETAISGTAETASLEAAGGTVRVTGTLKADRLAANTGTHIAVGDDNGAGKLSAASVSLGGGTVFLDPAWQGNDTLEAASHGALIFSNDDVDGQLAAGRNSLLVLGEAAADRAVSLFKASGMQWGQNGITAALSVQAPQHLDPGKGSIVVDGSLTSAPAVATNTVTFGEGSLLVVDAAGLNGHAALASEGGSLKVAGSSSLLLGNASVGEYVITAGFADNTDVRGWEGNALSTPDQLIGLSLDKSDAGTVRVHARALDAGTVLPGVALPNILNQVWSDGRNSTDSSNAGIAFLSKAVDKRYVAGNDTVRTINGAAQLAVAAGMQASTLQASDSVNRALQEHLSLTGDVDRPGASPLHREGADLWASMLYRDNDSSGIKAGSFSADYKNDFGGVIVGADYTWKDMGNGRFRAGGALNIGKGDGKSRGDFNYTKNDYDTYGISAYGSWNRDNANIMVDIGYMKGDNELRQSVPAALGGSLKADVDTQVWTVGTRGEYRFRTAALDVTPHIGARYLRLKTDAFNTHNNQGTVFYTDSDTQNLWQIPVGVTLSRNYVAENGWTVKPKLDISFIPVTGDREASTRIHVPGVGASDVASATIMDSTGWSSSLGLEMVKDRTRLGIRVGYQKSDDARSRGAMLTLGRQFD